MPKEHLSLHRKIFGLPCYSSCSLRDFLKDSLGTYECVVKCMFKFQKKKEEEEYCFALIYYPMACF